MWKNNFPIVLVHGYGGMMQDKSLLMGDMWAYAKQADAEVYLACTNFAGGIHDRACELYQ